MVDFNHDDDSVTNTGQAIAAINIGAFGDVEVFKASDDTPVHDLRSSSRMSGVDRISVPGERSHETRVARGRDGIPIAPALLRGLTCSPVSLEWRSSHRPKLSIRDAE